MTIVLAIAAIAVLVLLFIFAVARRHTGPITTVDELLARAVPVDLEAFRNLTDPSEERFLRENLSAGEFRRIQRKRLRTAADYVRGTAHNASLLLRMAQAARREQQVQVVRSAEAVVSAALRLRLCCTLALVLLSVRMIAPRVQMGFSNTVHLYEGVRERFLQLSRLRCPAQVGRIAAAL